MDIKKAVKFIAAPMTRRPPSTAKSAALVAALAFVFALAATINLGLQPWFGLVSNATAQTVDEAKTSKNGTRWTCPMHPHYISDDPGSCPICGMDLVKIEGDQENASASGQRAERTSITIAPEVMQNMGVRLAAAETSKFGRIIRSFGRVAASERLQSEITARTEGWIEDLRIRAVGDRVKAGDLLFSLYAPEFAVSQSDLLQAIEARDRSRIDSVKTRLRAFGMQDRAIEQIPKAGKPLEFVPFYAEQDGTVAMINLRPGSYVKRGTMLTRIQDYSQVWLMVSVSEQDLGFIEIGTPARVTFPNSPGREIFARVEYVYPTVDPQTRTGQVRLVIDNPDGGLRPGAYADVAFDVEIKERLAVPSEAILKSGSGRYVVASLGDGRFQPRTVTTGLTNARWTEVSGEIATGDKIVVSGQFLIDSESALRESFQKLERLQLDLSLLKPDKVQLAMIDHMVDAALYIHEALADGYDIDPKQLDPAIAVKTTLWPAYQNSRLANVLTEAVVALEAAKNARTNSELSSALNRLVQALQPWMLQGAPGHYKEKGVRLFRDQTTKRLWIQMSPKPVNPYGSGKAMTVEWPDRPNPPESASAPSPAASQSKPKIGGAHDGH